MATVTATVGAAMTERIGILRQHTDGFQNYVDGINETVVDSAWLISITEELARRRDAMEDAGMPDPVLMTAD